MEKKVFGEVAALIYVVEFQKRGLPHAHFLIILKPEHKIVNPESFDKYVSAEIPSAENPHLRRIVLKHMMHGPCGLDNPTNSCMRKEGGISKCKSSYPKSFNQFTTTGKDCYLMYRRRDTEETVRVRGKDLDNRWVVPYNPYLLAMFDYQINVELCSSVKAVKYLYKYVYKGHDRVSFSVVEGEDDKPVDEIDRYQAGHWVSSLEAAWRIFGFPLFEIYPPVVPLPVYTHNGQYVRSNEREDLQHVLENENNSKTLLTEFFKKNSEDAHGPKYLYSEYPEHFTWHQPSQSWRTRKRGVVIGRMASVSHGDGERYYLRLLLASVPGPRSFDDLLIVEGYRCATFQESALKRRLLESDESVENCMDEAVHVQMAHALRCLFATILIFCNPAEPKKLWDKYYDALYEDYRRQYPHNEQRALQLTSQKVEEYLEVRDG